MCTVLHTATRRHEKAAAGNRPVGFESCGRRLGDSFSKHDFLGAAKLAKRMMMYQPRFAPYRPFDERWVLPCDPRLAPYPFNPAVTPVCYHVDNRSSQHREIHSLQSQLKHVHATLSTLQHRLHVLQTIQHTLPPEFTGACWSFQNEPLFCLLIIVHSIVGPIDFSFFGCFVGRRRARLFGTETDCQSECKGTNGRWRTEERDKSRRREGRDGRRKQ